MWIERSRPPHVNGMFPKQKAEQAQHEKKKLIFGKSCFLEHEVFLMVKEKMEETLNMDGQRYPFHLMVCLR